MIPALMGPQMSNKIDEAWERIRPLLEEIAEISESLSGEELNKVGEIMDSWMNENGHSDEVVDAELVQ